MLEAILDTGSGRVESCHNLGGLLYRKPKNVSLFTNGESAGLLLTANAVIAIRILWLAKEKTCWHTISGRGGRIHRMRCLDSKAN